MLPILVGSGSSDLSICRLQLINNSVIERPGGWILCTLALGFFNLFCGSNYPDNGVLSVTDCQVFSWSLRL